MKRIPNSFKSTPQIQQDMIYRGFSRQPENSKRAHMRVPALQKHHQNSTRRPPEREKRSKMGAGEGKESAKFWAVRRRRGPAKGGGPEEEGPADTRTRTNNTTHPHNTHNTTHTNTQTDTQTHTNAHKHTHTNTHRHTHKHTQTHTNTHKHTQTDTQTHTNAHKHTQTHTDLNQNVRVSMKVEKKAGQENAHTQSQKCGKRGTQ